MAIAEYLTEGNLRLAAAGAGSAALVVVLAAGWLRDRLAWVVGFAAPLLALFVVDRLDWPDVPDERVGAAAAVALLGGFGHERLRRSTSAGPLVADLALLAAGGGIFLAVPETGVIVTIAGCVAGVAVAGRRSGRFVGMGLAAAAAWAVVAGSAPTGYSFDGGLLCLAPLAAVAVVDVVWRRRPIHLPGWVVVPGAGAVALAASRWVAVDPAATWSRVAVIALSAVVLASVTER